jgi:hypothetical protein
MKESGAEVPFIKYPEKSSPGLWPPEAIKKPEFDSAIFGKLKRIRSRIDHPALRGLFSWLKLRRP